MEFSFDSFHIGVSGIDSGARRKAVNNNKEIPEYWMEVSIPMNSKPYPQPEDRGKTITRITVPAAGVLPSGLAYLPLDDEGGVTIFNALGQYMHLTIGDIEFIKSIRRER